MPYERATDTKLTGGENLDAFVTNMGKLYSTQIASRNAADETRFNELVLEGNMSLEDQLSYRKEQLKRVSDDPAEKKRVKEEIGTLTDRVEQKKFADVYLAKLLDYSEGASSIDSVISWLEGEKANTTDPTIKTSIQKELATQYNKKFELDKNALAAQSQYAINDKTLSIIDGQISKVQSAKNKALLSNNNEQVAMLDLQLQGLNKAKAEAEIDKDTKDFAVSNISGYASATKLLDAYNSKLASSSATTPVTIGGVTYGSSQEYWRYKRDSYLADQSSAGFFSRFSGEQDASLKTKNSQNQLTTNDINDTNKAYTQLLSRPELSDYQFKINTEKQSAMQTGADLLATKAYLDYTVDYDITKATSTLNTLKALGANVDEATSKVLVAGANVKNQQVQSILNSAQEIMKNNPEMNPTDALNQAVKSGAGSVLSPQELTQKSETEITTQQANQAQKESYTPDTRTTIQGQYYRQKGTPEVYDISTGTPRHVTFEEANQKNIWGQIKDVDQVPGLPTNSTVNPPNPGTPAAPVVNPNSTPNPVSTPATPDQQRVKKTLIQVYNERSDVQNEIKKSFAGQDPFKSGTAANNWLNNWWNTSGKNEMKNVDLIS